MYIDESGDPGTLSTITGSENSRHFILTGLIVSINDWNTSFLRLKDLRRQFKLVYKLPIRTEIHAVELIRINKLIEYRKILKRDRINILKHFVTTIPHIFSNSKIINICFDKASIDCGNFANYSEMAWNRLLQRYDNFLKHVQSQGIVISDTTDEPLTRRLLRKMRTFNPMPSHYGGYYQAITDNIIEDPFLKILNILILYKLLIQYHTCCTGRNIQKEVLKNMACIIFSYI